MQLISLIPKKEGTDTSKDFKPISLVHSAHKIMEKKVPYILKEVLNGLISQNQSVFIGDRQSIDGVLVANECNDEMVKKGRIGVIY